MEVEQPQKQEAPKLKDKADEIQASGKRKTNRDKMQEDFSARVATFIPEQDKLAKSGKLDEAVDNLLTMEKQTRQGEDHLSTAKLAVAIVRICYESKNLTKLSEMLHVLAKRRGQFRSVIQDFVKEAMSYLQALDKPQRIELIGTLRSITEGKMFVELERARLTRILAEMKEAEGKIAEAADVLQEVQVETFGQMEREEKTDFILEQVRLCLDKKDYIKAQILSNKIIKRALNEASFQDLKIRYYTQMIRFYFHEGRLIDVCKSFMSMYDTPKVKENPTQWHQFLQLAALFALLSPYDNEQSDILNRLSQDPKLEQLLHYRQLVTMFLTHEVVSWDSLVSTYQSELNRHVYFQTKVDEKDMWHVLRSRTIQHNLRVLEKYYTRMRFDRIAQLLNLSATEVEESIAELVVSKGLYAKIDRPAGIVNFRRRKDPSETLNEWSNNIGDLLKLMNDTCHLISRENMVYKIESSS